jgi:hypothetical protein
MCCCVSVAIVVTQMCHSVMLYVYCLSALHLILLLLFHPPLLLPVHILTCFPASHFVVLLPFPIFHLVILVFCAYFFFLFFHFSFFKFTQHLLSSVELQHTIRMSSSHCNAENISCSPPTHTHTHSFDIHLYHQFMHIH